MGPIDSDRVRLSQDFHGRVSKLGFQELRVSKIPDRKSKKYYSNYVH